MHKTRNQISNLWSVPRKGTRFMTVSSHNQEKAIPVLVVLRDILKLGKTKKEIKRIILLEKIKINGKLIKDEKFPLSLFDILGIGEKDYKITIKNKRFSLEETKSHEKISKVIGKKILPGNKVQINLNDGRNFISKEKINVGDSIMFNVKENKISKIIPLKEGSEIIVISGSHIGETGKIEKINENTAEVKIGKEKINLEIDSLIAI